MSVATWRLLTPTIGAIARVLIPCADRSGVSSVTPARTVLVRVEQHPQGYQRSLDGKGCASSAYPFAASLRTMQILIALILLAGTSMQAFVYTRQAFASGNDDPTGKALAGRYRSVEAALITQVDASATMEQANEAFQEYNDNLAELKPQWDDYAKRVKTELAFIALSWALLTLGAVGNLWYQIAALTSP